MQNYLKTFGAKQNDFLENVFIIYWTSVMTISSMLPVSFLTLLQKMHKKWMALPSLAEARMQRWVILSYLVYVILFLF